MPAPEVEEAYSRAWELCRAARPASAAVSGALRAVACFTSRARRTSSGALRPPRAAPCSRTSTRRRLVAPWLSARVDDVFFRRPSSRCAGAHAREAFALYDADRSIARSGVTLCSHERVRGVAAMSSVMDPLVPGLSRPRRGGDGRRARPRPDDSRTATASPSPMTLPRFCITSPASRRAVHRDGVAALTGTLATEHGFAFWAAGMHSHGLVLAERRRESQQTSRSIGRGIAPLPATGADCVAPWLSRALLAQAQLDRDQIKRLRPSTMRSNPSRHWGAPL